MKVLLTFVGLAILASGWSEDSVAPKGLNEQIAQALENAKLQMPCGFPEQGIPPLVPFKKEYVELQYEHALFSILGNVFDLRVNGLDDFKTMGVTLSILTLKGTFDINFNKISAFGDYALNFFPLKFFRITGKGGLDIELKDLRIKGDFKMAGKGKGLEIKTLNVVTVLGDIKSNISGLLGGGKLAGKLANRTIEKFVKFFIKTQSNFITNKIREIIVPNVNEVLGKYSIKDILEIISSAQKPPNCIPPESKLLQLLEMLEV